VVSTPSVMEERENRVKLFSSRAHRGDHSGACPDMIAPLVKMLSPAALPARSPGGELEEERERQ
jgi:hypothetical protein